MPARTLTRLGHTNVVASNSWSPHLRSHIFALLLVPMTIVFGGCQKETRVYVECVGAGIGYNCTVTHQAGASTATACWDVNVTCINGATVTGNACQKVTPEQKVVVLIPVKDMKNFEKCDTVKSVAVENVKVTSD